MGGTGDQRRQGNHDHRASAFFLDQHAQHVQRFTNSNRLLSFLVTLPRFIIDTLFVTALITIAAILLARGRTCSRACCCLACLPLPQSG